MDAGSATAPRRPSTILPHRRTRWPPENVRTARWPHADTRSAAEHSDQSPEGFRSESPARCGQGRQPGRQGTDSQLGPRARESSQGRHRQRTSSMPTITPRRRRTPSSRSDSGLAKALDYSPARNPDSSKHPLPGPDSWPATNGEHRAGKLEETDRLGALRIGRQDAFRRGERCRAQVVVDFQSLQVSENASFWQDL